MYSFRMSFWIVPRSLVRETPFSSATAMYKQSKIAAVELMVIDVEILSSGRFARSVRMSSIESMATPTRPTSPSDFASSESRPICVGRSKATLSPVWPCARR